MLVSSLRDPTRLSSPVVCTSKREHRRVVRWRVGSHLDAAARGVHRCTTGAGFATPRQSCSKNLSRPSDLCTQSDEEPFFAAARFLPGPRFVGADEPADAPPPTFSYTPCSTRLMRLVASQRFSAG